MKWFGKKKNQQELDEMIFFTPFDIGHQINLSNIMYFLFAVPVLVAALSPFVVPMTFSQWITYLVIASIISVVIWQSLSIKVTGEVSKYIYLDTETIVSGHNVIKEQLEVEKIIPIHPRYEVLRQVLFTSQAFDTIQPIMKFSEREEKQAVPEGVPVENFLFVSPKKLKQQIQKAIAQETEKEELKREIAKAPINVSEAEIEKRADEIRKRLKLLRRKKTK